MDVRGLGGNTCTPVEMLGSHQPRTRAACHFRQCFLAFPPLAFHFRTHLGRAPCSAGSG
ncbi:hypothetical protein HPP92_011252 [Vanilla planifolia]|uniref:C2H2-type domain-containing protein n=1 Tax=Vanilla planifolia TaxID=51239 RepID=A0A835RB51_VANPL|nr:hypothetical protein HPP92_011252 [Vanilla planifolia]